MKGILFLFGGLLIIGAGGQSFFFPSVPEYLLFCVLCVPGLTVSILTFCNAPPPVSPRGFCYCLIFAMIWYTLATLTAEVFHCFFHRFPAADLSGPRIMMYAAYISFVPLIISCRRLWNYEIPKDTHGKAAPDDNV